MVDEQWNKKFGERLRKLSRNHGIIFQKDLCELTGISKNTMSRYWTGQQLPDIHTALLICDVIGCTLEELVTFE